MANAILGLLAETSLHAGASTSAGVIDLPIQREAHTGWPCVFGSGVKGALRTAAHDLNADWEDEVFGPSAGDNVSDHAGAIAVGDARLLLLPVRSLTGHFKWVTCPALLKRAVADCQRMNMAEPVSLDRMNPSSEQVIIPIPRAQSTEDQEGSSQNRTAPERLFLEELSFSVQRRDLTTVLQFLARFLNIPKAEAALGKQLAIVNDDIFAHLSQFATPVDAHIAIEYSTKTVKDGALWYEETLPPDTVLYSCLLAHKSRKRDTQKTAEEVMSHVTADLFGARPYIQLGGNETVGMGWCKVAVLTSAAVNPVMGGQ